MKTIYLEPDEEITSVVDRLRELDDKEVAIVVPKRAALLQSIVNLKLLRFQAEQQGKRINIVTTDKTGRNLASAVGLTVHQKMPEGGEAVKESAVREDADQPVEIQYKRRPPKEPKKPSDDTAGTEIGYKKGKGPELVKREIKGAPPEPPETPETPEPSEPAPALSKPQEPDASGEPRFSVPKTKGVKPRVPQVKLPKIPKPSLRLPKLGKLGKLGRRGPVIIVIALVVLLTGGTAAAVVLPRATVTVVPKTEPFKTKIPVKFSTTAPRVDAKDNIVPAKTIEITKPGSLKAQATGRSIGGEPARGEITVVNELNRNQPLVARTRFQSPDGKVFRAQSGIVVPAGGTTTVQVVADEGGTNGNLKRGLRLSIPGLQSTTAVYGKVDKNLSGGTNADDTTISQADVERAKSRLGQRLAEEGLAEAKKKLPVGSTLNPEVAAVTVLSSSVSPAVGATAKTFVTQGSARITYFAYDEKTLRRLIETDLRAKVPGGTTLVEQREERFAVGGSSDQELDTDLVIETFTVPGLSEADIAEAIAGKSPEEAKRVITGNGQATGVQIDLWPFWVRSLPGDAAKVEVRFNADPGASPSPSVRPSDKPSATPGR
ncbi:MAG: hypothetical protein Q8Q11_02045 [bacterium]|nr:hypothetical protein [bacterium]MDZ4247965.1 hypothetical protein [Patescibacteria group bacterium]